MGPEEIERYRNAADDGSVPDALNPLYLFSLTGSELLAKVAYGGFDPVFLAKRELVSRGLDREGKWIGFEQAEALHFPKDRKPKLKIHKRRGL